MEAGTLYLCATPIGNLEDMTYRAVRVLKEAAAVAAEDTRHTRKLLSHFDIHTPLVSYHEHNKAEMGPRLIERLLAGESIALVSDAGTPGISDPGADLVRLAVEAGVKVVPVPGANAALCTLVCSGLDTREFVFLGFLPKTKKKRRELLESLAANPYTMVFYEAPHRICDILVEMEAAWGERRAVIGRELTKKFEEFLRGTLKTLREHFEAIQPRGEFTLIVSGSGGKGATAAVPDDSCAGLSPVEAVAALMQQGLNKKEAIREVAARRGLPKRVVYQEVETGGSG